jgi:hypothetical protein
MKKIVTGLLSAAVMLGCVREIAPDAGEPLYDLPSLTADEIKFLTDRQMPTLLDDGEIDRVVADAIRLLEHAGADAATATRAATPRTVARIRPLAIPSAEPSTRAAPAPLFHAVDFADGRGYCIVAADRRLPDPIVCFVERGSFPDAAIGTATGTATPKAIENPGLALMLDAMGVYAARALDRNTEWCDSVSTALLTRTGAASLDDIPIPSADPSGPIADPSANPTSPTRLTAERYYPTWQFNRLVGPLLPVEWGQGRPFNATVVENTRWSSTPVGCVALAAVQVMAYWRHPANIDTLRNIDWDELRRWSGSGWNRSTGYGEWSGPMSDAPAATQKQIADILWHVGRRIDMNYGSSGSTAYTSRVVALLDTLGFSRGRAVKYSEKVVVEELAAGRPVMIDGASHRHTSGWHDNAHCWVIDGFMEERWWNARIIDRHLYRIEHFRRYLHNDFGWNGSDNGWYVAGMFDANNNPDLPSSAQTPPPDDTRATADEWIGEHYNYQFMQTIYVGIRIGTPLTP